MLKRAKSYIGTLTGNARVCIFFHPLWGIPYSFYSYYLSLYLKECGTTDAQLGILMTVAAAASFVFSIVSAPIVDAMGRKKATFVFDLISSVAPTLIYFISGSFIFALCGTILFNSNKIMSVAYFLLMVEDAGNDERMVAMNLFNIITVVAGLILPAAGIFVDMYGVVATERVFLLISFISMLAMILLRNRLLRETGVGLRIMARRKNQSGAGRAALLKGLLHPYKGAFGHLAGNRQGLLFTLAYVFLYAYVAIGTNTSLYFVPYFTGHMGMDAMQSSVLGGVYYAGMLAAMVLVNPLLGGKRLFAGLHLSGVVSLAGLAGMVLLPARMFAPALAAVFLLAAGYGIMKSGVEGAFAIYTEGSQRSGIYSLSNLLSSLVGMVASSLCAVLYVIYPGWLYLLCIAMVLVIMVCVALAQKAERGTSGTGHVAG